MADYEVGQIVEMKKTHPCGSSRWEIIRVGMDFRIRCIKCSRSIMLSRVKFEKSARRVIPREE
ncbi:DUF951 domain-containing protein [Candidatus Contubernalis alkaliaceticus]|uniref:DUF951 domain-containing protein n=1 Tax=Candidatus Contubernalis alkaliaceticus TaxID=338645 RepID=UPI001F4BFD9F|nr:DUF951 domain-containing protein [Candidatus Contubernalis alkalaceticus]UNC93715.1 DUF951 domain-containing protein [Candidatus Contubernalis alkalaceticus]